MDTLSFNVSISMLGGRGLFDNARPTHEDDYRRNSMHCASARNNKRRMTKFNQILQGLFENLEMSIMTKKLVSMRWNFNDAKS